MFKLIINDYKYYYPDNTTKDTIICRIKSTLIDTDTNTTLSEFNQSSRVVRHEEDDPDEVFAKNLAFSRAKIKSYRVANRFIKSNYYTDYSPIIGEVYMDRFEKAETNHINYISEEESENSEYDMVIDVLRKVLDELPRLRGEHEYIRDEIRDALNEIEYDLD